MTGTEPPANPSRPKEQNQGLARSLFRVSLPRWRGSRYSLSRLFFNFYLLAMGSFVAIAFTAGGLAYWLLGTAGTTPWTFVFCAAIVFFTWGEIFSLFPSTCTDMFGPKYATTNTSLLYTAKGLSAFVVPLANILKSYSGSWHSVFAVAAIMNFLVVALALFVVRPMRVSISAAEKKETVPQAAE